MDIEKQKLQADLDAERRVSYAMACALGEISEVLGMDENDAGTLQAVKELLKSLKDAEFQREQFKSDADALRAELQKAKVSVSSASQLVFNIVHDEVDLPKASHDALCVFQDSLVATVPAMPMQSKSLSNDEIHNLLSGFELPMDTNSILDFAREIERAVIAKAMTMPKQETAGAVPEQPKLAVWYGSMPESNGRENWTAILHNAGDEGFDIFTDGHTIDRSEYPDRVKYAADCVRWMIGELPEKPFILDYDADKHSSYEPPSSPRITEQDAYDIILNFYWFMETFKNRHGKNPSVIEWRDAEGRALLNKLNANAVAEVRKEHVNYSDRKPHDWWRVEVSLYDGSLLAIEPEMLAGKGDLTDRDEETIRAAGRHLLAFVGDPVPSQAAAIPKTKKLTLFGGQHEDAVFELTTIPEGFAILKLESLKDALSECFDDGYKSPSTYNDVDMNDSLWIENERSECVDDVFKKLLSSAPKPEVK